MSLNLMERLEHIRKCCGDSVPGNRSRNRMCRICQKRLEESILSLKEVLQISQAS